jgi:prolyl-tRNA editing enzyme YbaK/EbsC (Cys-tRNA(Pro) deacylase)
MTPGRLGELVLEPAASRPDLMAASVAAGLSDAGLLDRAFVAAIDPALSDTAAFCDAYRVEVASSANCVVVAERGATTELCCAALVLATTRVDVNRTLRRALGWRKASFAPMEDAVAKSGMEYGAIGPVGLPAQWPIVIDAAVITAGPVVVGAGVRGAKLVLEGADLQLLPNVAVLEGLGVPRS